MSVTVPLESLVPPLVNPATTNCKGSIEQNEATLLPSFILLWGLIPLQAWGIKDMQLGRSVKVDVITV